jgi:hypothetical protein
MPWKTDIELKVGDKAIIYYLAVINALSPEYKWYKRDGKKVDIFITYENIYAIIRDGKIIPVNGYVLVEPVDNPEWTAYVDKMKAMGMEAVDTRVPSKKDAVYGKIAYMGTPNKEYFGDHKTDDGINTEVGDTVVLKKVRDIPMEYEFHAKMDGGRKLYRIQRHDIIAVV